MSAHTVVETDDWHTAGEPFRIVVAGAPELPGDSVADRRARLQASPECDLVRQLLCREPRGHAGMYGAFLVPPNDADAHLGVLFWHGGGYSTACGHGTIALGAWAVDTGRVPAGPDGDTDVVIDVPSGRVVARVRTRSGQIDVVTFRSVPSWVVARDVEVTTSRGRVRVDVAWGGAIYAVVSAADAGLRVEPAHLHELVFLGREVQAAVGATGHARHPDDDRLSGVYGTIIVEDLGRTDRGPHQRNVTVFGDGQVDRSPCGSGTAARIALLAEDGTLNPGDVLTHDSIVSSRFRAWIADGGDGPADRRGWVAEIEGTAHRTGTHRFVWDPTDALGVGFVLR